MSNPTFNAHIDYFELEEGTDQKFHCTGSDENRDHATANGANVYGDIAVVDVYGEVADPSSEYEVVGEVAHDPSAAATTIVTLGTVHQVTEIEKPVVTGTLSISTQQGSAPTVSVSGKMVQTGAQQLRAYKLPAFTLSPRHRAQDFLGLCTIKKGLSAASPVDDYGLGSVNANFQIDITLAQPNGEVKNYDLHGGMATVDYAMNWYGATEPAIELTAAAIALGASKEGLVSLASRSDPENGYTQYTWQVSFPLKGEEVAQQGE